MGSLPTTTDQYRPDIDGLRAIAVGMVLFFHSFPQVNNGGYAGVDVFFVISGYLISSIILEGLSAGRFSLLAFYRRRIRRIFPSLTLVLIVTYVSGWLLFLPGEFSELAKHVAGAAVFVPNFVFWSESGYFDLAADFKPLLHTWSLGIEEQFYIVWPLLLIFLARTRRYAVVWTALILLLSLWLNLSMVQRTADTAFYSPLTRAWELMVGAMIAIVASTSPAFPPHSLWNATFVRHALSLVGAALILGSFIILDRASLFPGLNAVAPVVGTAALITAGKEAWVNKLVLSRKHLVAIGLISYPTYLWHWPLLSFARIINGEENSAVLASTLLATSVVLAALTNRLVERPLRFGTHATTKASALVATMIVIGSLGFLSFRDNTFPFRPDYRGFEKIVAAAGEWEYPGALKPLLLHDRTVFVASSGSAQTTLFVGDSTIEMYWPRIAYLLTVDPQGMNSVMFATGGGCLPIPKVSEPKHPHCFGLAETSMAIALERPAIQTVVIGAEWFSYFTNGLYTVHDSSGSSSKVSLGYTGYQTALGELSDFIKALRNHGKQVYLLGNVPMGTTLDPRFMLKRSLLAFPAVLSIQTGGLPIGELQEKYGRISADVSAMAKSAGVRFIDPIAMLCGQMFCPSVDDDGEPIYKDGDHLRPAFVRKGAVFIDETVRTGGEGFPAPSKRKDEVVHKKIIPHRRVRPEQLDEAMQRLGRHTLIAPVSTAVS